MVQERGTFRDDPQEHFIVIRDEKVSPFVKFEIILPLFWFLLDLQTLQGMEFYDIFVNRFQDISKVENPAVRRAKV